MAIYFPAFTQALRTPAVVATHLHDFVYGFMSAFEHRFFQFSSYTASIFFDPSTREHYGFSNVIGTGYEQQALADLINSVLVSFEDVTRRSMPPWTRDDVLSYAQHYTRTSGVTFAPFVASLHHRFFAEADVQKYLATSTRGPTGANDLRNILYTFASVALLTKALSQTRANLTIESTHTPMMAVYLQRVIERFHAEPPVEFALRFNGPMNATWMMDGEPLYDPVRPVSKETQHILARVVVAAYRVLTASTAPAMDILSWTQVALNSFHTHPASMWAASKAASATAATRMPARTVTHPAAVVVAPAVTTRTATPTAAPTATPVVAVAPAMVPKTPKTPKTPQTPKTPKSTLRFEASVDNF